MPPIYRKLLVEYDDAIVSSLTVGVLRYPSEGGILGQALVLGPDNRLVFENISRDLTLAVTGTGATNYLPKFTAPRVLGLSQVYDNGTNVGFNTNLPTNTVDINGTLRVRQTTNATGNFVTLSPDGVLQQRTPAEVLLDIGAQAAGSYVTTDTTLTINGVTYDLTQNQTWNVGTVTSVGLTAPTGFIVTNSPVTESGTLTLDFATGYSLPTTSSQVNWNIAYDNRIDSLTTSGSSGPATLVSNVLNIPNYTIAGLGGVPETRTITINGVTQDLTADQVWTIAGGGGGGTLTYYTGSFPIQVEVNTDVSGSLYMTASHADSGVTPGTYNSVEVDAKGHVTSGSVVDVQTNNIVRVLRIPSSAINFANDLKEEIAAYINQLDPPLVIDETESKWNIVIDGILPNVIDDNTEINLWFDDSNSINAALPGLINMVDSCLKQLLLPIYNNDEVLYNQRVKIYTFTGEDQTIPQSTTVIPFDGKGPLAGERTFFILNTTGSSESISRVINLVYQDEASSIYHSNPFDPNIVTVTGSLDIGNLRTTLDNISDPNYYKGVIYQMQSATPDVFQTAFIGFLESVSTSSGSYTGSNSLESYFSSNQLFIEYGISISGEASYYLNLLSNTFKNSLGITNIADISSVTCYQGITEASTQVSISCSGSGGVIDIISVGGGTAPYTFTYTTGSIESSPIAVGTEATNIPDGTYSITIYDANNYRYVVRTGLKLDCTVAPLSGTLSFTCTNATGQNAQLNVTGVSGGTGTGYYFTLNGGTTQYTIAAGSGTANVPDGVYLVELFDTGDSSSITLGTVEVSCKTNYSINIYEFETCNLLGTGFVEYVPSTPLEIGKFYNLTDGNVAEIVSLTVGTVTHVVSDILTYFDSCLLTSTQVYIVTRYLCGTCTKLGKGTVAYNANLQVGKFYNTVNGEVVEISPILTTAPITNTIINESVFYGTCATVPCLQLIN